MVLIILLLYSYTIQLTFSVLIGIPPPGNCTADPQDCCESEDHITYYFRLRAEWSGNPTDQTRNRPGEIRRY